MNSALDQFLKFTEGFGLDIHPVLLTFSVGVETCTHLIQGVVTGVGKAVGVSGLSKTSSRLHLLLLLVQQYLRVHHVSRWPQVRMSS